MSVRLWTSPGWREQAEGWIDRRLADAGLHRTGPVEQPRVRPWATVLCAPTTRGVVWMKAAGAATTFEAALYELLAREAPEQVLAPLAIDASRPSRTSPPTRSCSKRSSSPAASRASPAR